MNEKRKHPPRFAVVRTGDEDQRPCLTWFVTESGAREYATTRAFNDAHGYTILEVKPVMDVIPAQPVLQKLTG